MNLLHGLHARKVNLRSTIFLLIMEDLLKKLLDRLENATKIVFLGIGEEKMTDDAFGPYLISQFLDNSYERFLFINAGVDPMSRMEEIVDFNPSHLVLLDTCTLNEEPGTVAILERENLQAYVPISSHTIPIHIVVDLLLEKIPKLDVFMIGVVPKSLDGFDELKLYKGKELTLVQKAENIDLPYFEIQMSEEIQEVADRLVQVIESIMKRI